MKIHIVICDDNPTDLGIVEEKVAAYVTEEELNISLSTYCYSDMLLLDFEEGVICPDILLLDIHMPRVNGVDVAMRLRELGYEGKIIFMTVSEDHYQDAFDVQAYNYLIKHQTSQERFERVLGRSIREVIEEESEYIVLSRAGEVRKIPLDDIRYFEMQVRIIKVHYRDQVFEYYSTMTKLAAMMTGHGFVKIHQAYLVSIQYIEVFSRNEVILHTGEQLPVSRGCYSQAREQFEIYHKQKQQRKERSERRRELLSGGQ